VEGVASRAGVGKATIYRRWRSKLPLVVEAFSLLPALEEVDTGDLVSDLKQMLRHYLELFN
jgi:AcrR family transcriptional regulator